MTFDDVFTLRSPADGDSPVSSLGIVEGADRTLLGIVEGVSGNGRGDVALRAAMDSVSGRSAPIDLSDLVQRVSKAVEAQDESGRLGFALFAALAMVREDRVEVAACAGCAALLWRDGVLGALHRVAVFRRGEWLVATSALGRSALAGGGVTHATVSVHPNDRLVLLSDAVGGPLLLDRMGGDALETPAGAARAMAQGVAELARARAAAVGLSAGRAPWAITVASLRA